MPTLTAEKVSIRYGARALFRDLSFTAGAGAPLAIVGANGSGKSSLLRVLAGVRGPDAGAVRLDVGGRRVPPERLPRLVGFVAPYLQHYDALSGAENLRFLADSYGLGAPGRTRAEALLEQVGLGGRGEDLLRTYSTGMRQRLRLAAALLHDPPVLLLDEPSATLDGDGRALVAALVADASRVVVVATNEPDEAALCARRVTLGGGGGA